MKVSIVMAYYNRLDLLMNTLKIMESSKHIDDIEIIVVDDASDEGQNISYMDGFGVKIIRIKPEEKTWHNPSVPFNRGFKEATGDIIIIQNPECLHVGDVIDYAIKNVLDNKYIAFACYSANVETSNKIYKLEDPNPGSIEMALWPKNNGHPSTDCQNGWYNHSMFNPNAFHFCSAITKKDLDELGGFDERYADGIGYDDVDLIGRIRAKGMEVEIRDYPFVIHQAHEPTDYKGNQELFLRNQRLFQTGTI